MGFIKCKKCNHYEEVDVKTYKLWGVGLVAFGTYGWFSYLFAGTGAAFFIAASIVVAGIICLLGAEGFAKNKITEKRCPECGEHDWDEVLYTKKI